MITFLSNLVKQTLQKNQSDTERHTRLPNTPDTTRYPDTIQTPDTTTPDTPDYVRIHHDFALDREQPTSNSTLDSTSEGNLFI